MIESFLLKGQTLRFRGHYVSGIRKVFMCRVKLPVTLNEVAAHQEWETTCRLLHLRVPGNSVDMNEAVAFHCHRSHSRVISIFLLDCTAAFSRLSPTPKELVSKFSFATMSSRPGSMRLFLTLVRDSFNVFENVNDVLGWRVVAIVVAFEELRIFVTSSETFSEIPLVACKWRLRVQ